MLSLSKILVPTDLSQSSARVLDEAQLFAAKFSAAIDVMYVWSPPALSAPESLITGIGTAEQPAARVAQEQRRRDAEQFRGRGAPPGDCHRAPRSAISAIPRRRSWSAQRAAATTCSSWAHRVAPACRTCCWAVSLKRWCAAPRAQSSPCARCTTRRPEPERRVARRATGSTAPRPNVVLCARTASGAGRFVPLE